VTCGRIRTARQIAAYGPVMASWGQRWFVTLTVPNVSGPALHGEVRRVLADIRQAAQNVRRRGQPFRALRKLEVTYNVRRRDFHPHLHLVVDSEAAARALVAEWLRAHPEAVASAQDVRPATSPAELLKYSVKSVVMVDGRATSPPAVALDTMFKALRGLRTVQPMGFKVAAAQDTAEDGDMTLDASTPAVSARTAPTRWEWVTRFSDWLDFETGEVLADFNPTPAHRQLLANIRADAHPPDAPA
jgi:CheY-like chemotaxis protein